MEIERKYMKYKRIICSFVFSIAAIQKYSEKWYFLPCHPTSQRFLWKNRFYFSILKARHARLIMKVNSVKNIFEECYLPLKTFLLIFLALQELLFYRTEVDGCSLVNTNSYSISITHSQDRKTIFNQFHTNTFSVADVFSDEFLLKLVGTYLEFISKNKKSPLHIKFSFKINILYKFVCIWFAINFLLCMKRQGISYRVLYDDISLI